MRICSNILVLLLILVIFVFSLYNSFSLARSLSILLIFLKNSLFVSSIFFLFHCLLVLSFSVFFMLKIMSPRQEELFFSLIFFLVLGIPSPSFFHSFCVKGRLHPPFKCKAPSSQFCLSFLLWGHTTFSICAFSFIFKLLGP